MPFSTVGANSYLDGNLSIAREHFATQGDANHFACLEWLKSLSETVFDMAGD